MGKNKWKFVSSARSGSQQDESETYLSAFFSFDERLLLTSEQFASEIRKMTKIITKAKLRCTSASFTNDILILDDVRSCDECSLCCTVKFGIWIQCEFSWNTFFF